MDDEERVGGVSPSENPPRNREGDRAKRGGGGAPRALRPETVAARQLRKEMSLPEVLLWQRLRGRKAGVKFRNQHPVGPYVVDFYCRESRLIIEVDGEVHNRGDRPMRDETRDIFLRENGYNVMHVPAADILKDADDVAASIASLAARPLHHRPSADGPPPRAGEDLQ
ncbi:MAG: hypothetical protein JWL96_11 [Sphingomonas bacterium]|uniref:endonuclease domain-containing protein n=1 Tax=Sphingomonas bacterium TaxID=1895847 RepID=UPI002A50F325|nr:hypothetical protein [Sphingomonas bacterium]